MGTDKNILDTIKENQLKAKIKELDNSINSYNGKISQCNQQIARAEQSYNSLLGFKNSVQSSQDCFFNANGSKTTVLQQVKSIAVNNTVAKKYNSGMERILNGPGSKIATGLYSFLINNINAELNRLSNSIGEYQNQINQYNSLIYSAQNSRRNTINDLREMEEC